jgi:subtilisin family serine protease
MKSYSNLSQTGFYQNRRMFAFFIIFALIVGVFPLSAVANPTQASLNTVQNFFIGFYKRPADPGGLVYWANRLDVSGGSLADIIPAFANSPEATALLGPINSGNISTVVGGFYQAAFGRAPDAVGLAFYVNGFNAGTFTPASIIINILDGAQGTDRQTIDNKRAAANFFTLTIDPLLDGNLLAMYDAADIPAARDFLSPISFDPATAKTAADAERYVIDRIANPDDSILTSSVLDKYIVVFQQGTTRDALLNAQNIVKQSGGSIGFTYTSALLGFSFKAPASVVQSIRKIPGVLAIEADQRMSINVVTQPPTPLTPPPTGLDRTDTRLLPLDGLYKYSNLTGGAGVHAYVIDTGILIAHTDFGGRASVAFDTFGGTGIDCNSHGTHVAGTIGGTTYGIAKQVNLHAVRVLDCAGNGTVAGVIAGVDWVTLNATHPAVANMSLGGGFSAALNTAVTNSIAAGITYAVAAGNDNVDACGGSPASTPTAITVGAIDPLNDNRPAPPAYAATCWGSTHGSNFGSCLDLFAPGHNILSDGIASTTATAPKCGTSMAAPHVAGVVARYLTNHPAASPATVWNHLHVNTNNIFGVTAGWPGIINRGAGSPNELLHYGFLDTATDNGDPHITTVDGVHYDFQGAGEFVSLRDANGLQIQTRQTPVNGICVSLNTAVAARVGTHRVSYQPNINGVPDPSGLQLRVDGVLTTLGASGLNLGEGARVANSAVGSGITINFPDETILNVIPNFWTSQGKWYLNVNVANTSAAEGLMGVVATNSWLPALPDGTSLGPLPAAAHQQYVDLNQTFANAWRVTDSSSLFDYAPGTSTKTFTLNSWPAETPPCTLAGDTTKPPVPLDAVTAQRLCSGIIDKNNNANCIFDVTLTGEPNFAETYLLSQKIEMGATTTNLNANKNPAIFGDAVIFTATVARTATLAQENIPIGTVQLTINGRNAGEPQKLDAKGQASWSTSTLDVGDYQVAVKYTPNTGSVFLDSSSVDLSYRVNAQIGTF